MPDLLNVSEASHLSSITNTKKLPDSFVEKMRGLLGGEAEDFFAALTQAPKVSGLRCNTLKTTTEKLVGLLDIPLTPVAWCSEGFTFPSSLDESRRPSKSPFFHAGLYYLQEPSAMSSAELLDVKPGEKVLDLCAAPGGKAVQIAGKLNGQGVLVANDASATRGRALVKNLATCGARNAVILNEQPYKLSTRFVDFFDKILVDAPCSGEGMFRKDPDAIKGWTVNKPETCVALQREILHHAASMLKPGGRMVYSTCTFDPRENEGIIDNFLDQHPDFTIVAIEHQQKGFTAYAEGHPEWISGRESLRGTARLWPHHLTGEGHFLCVLQRQQWQKCPEKQNRQDGQNRQKNFAHNNISKGDNHKSAYKLPPIPRRLFDEFCRIHLTTAFEMPGTLLLQGNALYAVPLNFPDLSGIRVARSGWYLGEIKKERFEPSHAFALGLTLPEATFIYNIHSPADIQCVQYLRGESLEFQLEVQEKTTLSCYHDKAWTLICVAGYPLGWARMSSGRLKNKLRA